MNGRDFPDQRMKPANCLHPAPSDTPGQVVLAQVGDFVAEKGDQLVFGKLVRECGRQDDGRVEQTAHKRRSDRIGNPNIHFPAGIEPNLDL